MRVRYPWKQGVTCRDGEHPPAPGMKLFAFAGVVLCALALAACDQPGNEAATAEGTASAAPDQLPKPDGPVTYDPASCPQDADGMVYVTLYGMVFKFPHEDPLMFGAVPPNELNRVPQPSNPDAPEGCPGHPLRASNISLTYHYADVKADRTASRTGRLDQLHLVGVGDMYWGNQLANARYALAVCHEGEIRQVTEVLSQCRLPQWRSVDSANHVASPLEYATPYGQLFVANCRPFPSGSGTCTVAYKIHRGVNLSYRFKPRNIPLASIIDVDRDLRIRIGEMFVPELSSYPLGSPEDLLKNLVDPKLATPVRPSQSKL